MAEAYRDEIARRTHRGLEGLARARKPTGGRAFGYVAARNSGTGSIEINENEASIIRRIFAMYADGASPRTIAATLNAEAVPSPGSSWNRSRRRKSGWLASAIHGDVTRGSGILNNRRYIGEIIWGRSSWQRGAADSSKRRMAMNAQPAHKYQDERLRIVPQELWSRAKKRQTRQSHGVGTLVRGGLRKRAGGAGRPGKYLLTGLLVCGICSGSFVMRNRAYYACSSHWHGRACTNSINVSRSLVEAVLLDGIRDDLESPGVIADVERRVRAALKTLQRPQANHGKRITELQSEVDNLTDAIAAGVLRDSPALATRLAAAEAEIDRLQRRQPLTPVTITAPDVPKRFLAMVNRLDEVLTADPERGRAALRDVLGERITLQPDKSGKYLWAEYSLGIAPLLQDAGASADLMVAGACFLAVSDRPIPLVAP